MEAFVFGAAFVGGFLPQQAHSQAADGGEVRGSVAVLWAALVFAEDHIEHPVLAVFDRPVATNRHRQKCRLRGVAADVEARFPRLLALDFPRDETLPHDELLFCDLTTGPTGQALSIDQRLTDIRRRYDIDSLVRQFIDGAEHELRAAVQRASRRLDRALVLV